MSNFKKRKCISSNKCSSNKQHLHKKCKISRQTKGLWLKNKNVDSMIGLLELSVILDRTIVDRYLSYKKVENRVFNQDFNASGKENLVQEEKDLTDDQKIILYKTQESTSKFGCSELETDSVEDLEVQSKNGGESNKGNNFVSDDLVIKEEPPEELSFSNDFVTSHESPSLIGSRSSIELQDFVVTPRCNDTSADSVSLSVDPLKIELPESDSNDCPFSENIAVENFEHRELIIRDNIFICSKCGRNFNNLKHLEKHEPCYSKIHPNLKCSKCGKQFKIMQLLRTHEFYCESKWVNEFSCFKCGKKYMDPKLLIKHEVHCRFETSKKKLKGVEKLFAKFCIQCNQMQKFDFISTNKVCPKCEANLVLECKMCGKIVHSDVDAKNHLRKHLNPKLYHIKKLQSTANESAKIHPDNNKYTVDDFLEENKINGYYCCGFCDFTSTHKEKFIDHIACKHTRQMHKYGFDFCSKCNTKFLQLHLLRYHELFCDQYFEHSCAYCYEITNSLATMAKHMNNIHSDKFNDAEDLVTILVNINKRSLQVKQNHLKRVHVKQKQIQNPNSIFD